MKSIPRSITVGQTAVQAIVTYPDAGPPRWGLVYAPGAGSNINDPFGAYAARALSDAGIAMLRFQFPYMEARRPRPDSPAVLDQAWNAAIATANQEPLPWVIGGRSMGGRVASIVASKRAPVEGLALFAYPLHQPKHPEKWRAEHLARISVPTLFCSGTRDTFGTPNELREAAALVPGSTVHLLEGADHGFTVLKSSGRTREAVWREAIEALLAWWEEAASRTH